MPPKKYDIFTVFDTCVDFLISGDDVVPEFGQKEKMVGDYTIELGGSNVIFASQCAKLGLRTAGVGVVGNDIFGDVILSRMNAAGIDTRLVRKDAGIRSGVGVILCKNEGDKAILTYSGSIAAAEPEMITDEILSSIRHLHIGSFFLLGKMRPHFADIARRAKSFGATVSVDTNWDPDETWGADVLRLLETADVFLPNENEAMLISGEKNAEDAMLKLGKHVPLVAVKMGKDGAMAYDGKQVFKSPSHAVEIADTVGAGDSFDGGFLYGFLNKLDIQTCLAMACCCGSMSTRARGGTAKQICKPELEILFK
jgi:sugar/nucleoside kinase (ribokinase family)